MYRRRSHHLRALSALGLAFWGLAACATGSEAQAPKSYRERIEERIREDLAGGTYELRFNPVRCGCPPLELRLGGRWYRATLRDFEGEVGRALLQSQATDEEATHRVTGRLAARPQPCGQASFFLVLDADSWLGTAPDG